MQPLRYVKDKRHQVLHRSYGRVLLPAEDRSLIVLDAEQMRKCRGWLECVNIALNIETLNHALKTILIEDSFCEDKPIDLMEGGVENAFP